MMNRRQFVRTAIVLLLLAGTRTEPRAAGSTKGVEPYFPSAAHQFVWRNWDLIPAERIAAALACPVETVRKLAAVMDLEPADVPEGFRSRTWFKTLRRNWDFVPFSQITVLLDMPEQRVREMMIPFNFVENHLGAKPECSTVRVDDPARLPTEVLPRFRCPKVQGAVEPRFGFLDALRRPLAASPRPRRDREASFSPRIVFPYSALYGDMLGEKEIETYYPSGVLENVARMGLDAIWLHGILRELVPSSVFPEFGAQSAARLRRLNRLIQSAKRHGLGVYLFLNEPRGLPEAFFDRHPEIKGARGRPTDVLWSMCTSTEPVRRFLTESTERLFQAAPDLAGIILITASEAPTNCYSIHRKTPCPRCAKRDGPEVIAEVVRLIERGARRSKPTAGIVVWDWSWTIVEKDPQKEIIDRLPATVTLMVDFERGTPIERMGVKTKVNEYCLSVPGPSPRAMAHIRQARERGMPVMAKVQVGNTWESGLLPYIPVPSLVARKFQAMWAAGISGTMASWTLGSYPSPNWEIAEAFCHKPLPDVDQALRRVAARLYGDKAAPRVVRAWTVFADAFQRYPFSITLVYSSVVQCGPAHRMYFEPTGKTPGIINTYDTLSWTNPFGPRKVADAFADMASAWRRGLEELEAAMDDVPQSKRRGAERDLNVCRAVSLYFKSISNQVRFRMLRERWRKDPSVLAGMADRVREEIELATQLYGIARSDSRIGFEPSLQYFYLPLDIRERIASCRYMLEKQIPEAVR